MSRRAILLVGGRGTRLAPLTNNPPKSMLQVAGILLLTAALFLLERLVVGMKAWVVNKGKRRRRSSIGCRRRNKAGILISYIVCSWARGQAVMKRCEGAGRSNREEDEEQKEGG